jgi:predicted acyl esterase
MTGSELGVHHEVGYLRMRDGIRLAYVIWRAKRERKHPAVVAYGTYHQSGTDLEEVRYLLTAGYAYMGVNVRGTGGSEGSYSYYQPIEAEDGVEIIEWLAAQPWSNGNVGMIGSSYLGHTQIKVASLQPRHLRAIVPIATEGNEYRDEARSGGLFNVGLMAIWTRGNQPQLEHVGIEARTRAGDIESAAIRAVQPRNPAFEEVRQHRLYDQWWKARALDTMVDRVTVPTLLIHAWQDEWIRPNGALRLFKLLKCSHKRLIVQNGPHRLRDWAITQREQMRWLDRWVKEEKNGVDVEPPVTVYWEVVEPEEKALAMPSWTTSYSTWPVPGLQWVTFYLTASGRLLQDVPSTSVDVGIRSYTYPIGTELVGSNEQFALVPHPLGTLSYQTSPMSSDLALLGAPQLILHFSSDATDTDFLFTLKDIDPDGNALFLQRSVLRASMRAVDEAQSTPDEIIQSFAEGKTLVPGEIVEVRLSLSALGHVLRQGHRLELSILAPSAIPNPIWGFASTAASAVNNVYHGGTYLSQLRLPVVPEEIAKSPAPRLGTLRNQPYRAA